MKRLIILTLLSTLAVTASGQGERSDVRRGNELFQQGLYTQAETAYKQAQQKNATSYESAFNLGGALYKQNRWEEAAAGFSKLIEDKSDRTRQSEALYNLGNTYVKMRKLPEAIESYKNALKLNPSDVQAKFNLAYAQKLKEEDDKKNQDQNKDKDKDQNQNQDQNKDKNEDQKQDQNKDKEKDKNKDPNKDDQQDQQPPQQQPSKDSEQMLKAVQAAEDQTKQKVDKQKAEAVGKSGGSKQW